MLGLGVTGHTANAVGSLVGQAAGIERTTADVFDDVYIVFLIVGTVVGVVVIGYTVYNALKYRDGDEDAEDAYADDPKVSRPRRGELPSGSGGGKKLFVSFGLSAIIVLSLIAWTYGLLQFVEAAPDQTDEDIEVDVIGTQFSWIFVYPNGEQDTTLRVPQGKMIELNVTSRDVFHNIGIPAMGVKADAIPGQTTSTWFVGEETGTYQANCYELCGSGHSVMTADVEVMPLDDYRNWYNSTEGS